MTSALAPVSPAPRLFGREELLSQLQGAVDQDCEYFGLEGVTGVGKSAIAAAIAAYAAARNGAMTVSLNIADIAGEPYFHAALYSQLKAAQADTELEAVEICARIVKEAPGITRKLLGAVFADVVKAMADKAENVVAVVQDVIGGDGLSKTIADAIIETNEGNQRYFLSNHIRILAELGIRAVIVIDNYEGSEPSTGGAVRHLVDVKPPGWIVIVLNNNEKPHQADWSQALRPHLNLKAAETRVVPGLPEAAVDAWYRAEMGAAPSPAELAEIMAYSNGGRAQIVRELLAAKKAGQSPPRLPNLDEAHRARRQRLSPPGRVVAELVALAKADALVPVPLVEGAATKCRVSAFPAALDELLAHDEFRRSNGAVGFYHSSYHNSWLASLTPGRINELLQVWYDTLVADGTGSLANAGASALLAPIAPLIAARQPAGEVLTLSRRLVGSGTQTEALAILDASWNPALATKDGGMIEHALLAAKTRIDLGRYAEADEALRFAENVVDDDLLAQAKLLRMKLSLRRNVYDAVWTLSTAIEHSDAERPELQIERELILNTALRDVLDYERLRSSVVRLKEMRGSAPNELIGNLDRGLARSLAKLGDTDEAIEAAREAIQRADEAGDVRALANAHLALGEALRYARNASAADAYTKAIELARAAGARDCLIWATLGLSAAHLANSDFVLADEARDSALALVTEPGFDHPLETAHVQLLQTISQLLAKQAETGIDVAISAYGRLGVDWPKSYLVEVRSASQLPSPIPL